MFPMTPNVPQLVSLAPQPAFTAIAAPEPSIGRLPFAFISATTAAPELHNNAHGGQLASTAGGLPSMAATIAAGAGGAAPLASGPLSFPTLFLAQMLGQDFGPEAQNIIIDYEKLMRFSAVKYKPSDALLPKSDPAGQFSDLLSGGLRNPAALAEAEAGERVQRAAEVAVAITRGTATAGAPAVQVMPMAPKPDGMAGKSSESPEQAEDGGEGEAGTSGSTTEKSLPRATTLSLATGIDAYVIASSRTLTDAGVKADASSIV